MGITFGAIADPLRKQLEGEHFDAGTINHYQRDVDAITRLHVRGFLTDAETSRARIRVLKKLYAIRAALDALKEGK
jgi:hypothetical protein